MGLVHPISDDPFGRTVTADDLCSACRNLAYRPGAPSVCRLACPMWPANLDEDGHAITCASFDAIATDGENLAGETTP